jgi:hypothetical protein
MQTHRQSRNGVLINSVSSFLHLFFNGCAALFTSFLLSSASAQEALRNSLAGDAAMEGRRQRSADSMPYTIKLRELRILLTPSLALDWIDNINISRTNPQQDLTLSPSLQVAAIYPLTDQNLLSLNMEIGYQKYIDHDEFSTWFLRSRSGTGLNFDMAVKDVWINFHDQVNYIQDTAQQSTLANTADYSTLNNTAGLKLTWDLNAVTLSAGYDHANTFALAQQFNFQDQTTESILGQVGFLLNSKITAGLEGTAAFTSYDQKVHNDGSSYSLGGYADWQPGKYFRVQPRIGYTISKFNNTSSTMRTSDLNSWYFDLNVSHQATDEISYSLEAGHGIGRGIESDAVDSWFVRPNVNWNIVKNLGLNTYFSYEYGSQGVGNVTGNLTETYDWLSAGFTASYPLMKKFSLALTYRLTLRTSNALARDYTQNVVGLVLTYHAE